MNDRYVALQDVTLHKKIDEIDGPEGKGKEWLTASVTLVPGESIGIDELSPIQEELYENGKLDHLIKLVPEQVAVELGRKVAAGDDVTVKSLGEMLESVAGKGVRKAKDEKSDGQ